MKRVVLSITLLLAALTSAAASSVEFKARKSADIEAINATQITDSQSHFDQAEWSLTEGTGVKLTLSGNFRTPFWEVNAAKFALKVGSSEITFSRPGDMCVAAEGVRYLLSFFNEKLPPLDGTANIYLSRPSKQMLRWQFESFGNVQYGDIKISSRDLCQGVCLSLPSQFEGFVEVVEFSLGDISASLPQGAVRAVELPYDTLRPEVDMRFESPKVEGVEHLSLNGITGEVTRKELNDLATYFIKRPLVTNNYLNTMFLSWTRAYMMEWCYEQTQNREVLDRLIEQGELFLELRDDKTRNYATRVGEYEQIYTPTWCHESCMGYFNGVVTKKFFAISDFGNGINHTSVAARIIASDRALWDEKYDKKRTYREVAMELLAGSMESWQFILDRYYRSATHLLRSPAYAEEPAGRVPQWNRVFPVLTAGNVIVDAYELFGLEDESVEKIDRCVAAMLRHFWENSYTIEVNGKECAQFPYGVFRWDNEPDHTEDLTHMAFDARGFRVFAESGRYWTKRQSELVSNTVNELMVKDDRGTFAWRMDGSNVVENYSYTGAVPEMLWYTEFVPELNQTLTPYAVSLMDRMGYLDGRTVFHILHMRAKYYGIEK